VRQWFLAVNVFLAFQSQHRRGSMSVFASAHRDGIEFLRTFEQLAKVDFFASLRKSCGRGIERFLIDVTQGNDIFRFQAARVGTPSPARTDDGNIQFVVQIPPSQYRGRCKRSHGRSSNALGKLPARQRHWLLTGTVRRASHGYHSL
jgi:hypothetical protein